MDIRAQELFLTNIGDFELFSKWVSSRLKSQVEFKTSGLFEFQSPAAAEEFVDRAVTYVKQRADSLLSSVRDRTSQEIQQARQSLLELLEQETKPIIEGACQRLNKAFNLDLSLPSMQ